MKSDDKILSRMRHPRLLPGASSWVIVNRRTGQAVRETFEKTLADRVNRARYEVLPILEYLQRFNASVKG